MIYLLSNLTILSAKNPYDTLNNSIGNLVLILLNQMLSRLVFHDDFLAKNNETFHSGDFLQVRFLKEDYLGMHFVYTILVSKFSNIAKGLPVVRGTCTAHPIWPTLRGDTSF